MAAPPAAFTVLPAPPRPRGASLAVALRRHERGVRSPALIDRIGLAFSRFYAPLSVIMYFSAVALLDAALCAWPRALRERDALPLAVAVVDIVLRLYGGERDHLSGDEVLAMLGCTAAADRHAGIVADVLDAVGFQPLVRSPGDELVAAARLLTPRAFAPGRRSDVLHDAVKCLRIAVADPVLSDMQPRDLAVAALEVAARAHSGTLAERRPGAVAARVWARVCALRPQMGWSSKGSRAWQRLTDAMPTTPGGSRSSSAPTSRPPGATPRRPTPGDSSADSAPEPLARSSSPRPGSAAPGPSRGRSTPTRP